MKFKLEDVLSDKYVGLLFTEQKQTLFLVLAHHYSSQLASYFFNGYSPYHNRITSVCTHDLVDGVMNAEETELEPTNYQQETSVMGRRGLVKYLFTHDII